VTVTALLGHVMTFARRTVRPPAHGSWNADFQGGDGRSYELALCLDRREQGMAEVPNPRHPLLRSHPVEVLAEAIGHPRSAR
jgi:hypothetical protein